MSIRETLLHDLRERRAALNAEQAEASARAQRLLGGVMELDMWIGVLAAVPDEPEPSGLGIEQAAAQLRPGEWAVIG